MKKPKDNNTSSYLATEVDEVKVVNKSYLTKEFKPSNKQNIVLLQNIVQEFSLNEEQERAFRIVANHAIQDSNDQLLMYLGGMAGTGKSQVLKALIEMFKKRQEEYRLQGLAPTGTAAALIGGSTYHSVLGINQYNNNNLDSVQKTAQIYERIKNLDYIFIDEISMIDCKALNTISARLCTCMGIHDKPFGGKNVILASDFAQLPPVSHSLPLYSRSVKSTIHKTDSISTQQQVMGKFIWHMFTTVVILRQNMRQRSASPMDVKFKTVLENL